MNLNILALVVKYINLRSRLISRIIPNGIFNTYTNLYIVSIYPFKLIYSSKTIIRLLIWRQLARL